MDVRMYVFMWPALVASPLHEAGTPSPEAAAARRQPQHPRAAPAPAEPVSSPPAAGAPPVATVREAD
eukprot:3538628-Prymnesium_polylepis.1